MFRRIFLLLGVLFSLSLFADERDFDFEYWTKHGMKFAIGSVTVEQAKQAIINWSGRQNLTVELLPLYAWGKPFMGRIPNFGISASPTTLPIAQYTTQYAFSVQDPNPDGKYTGTVLVDSYTGQIQELLKGLSELREDQNIANMLSPQQAMERARQWVASYFPNIPIASMFVDFVFPPLSEDGSKWENYSDYVTFGFFNRTSTPDGETVELLLQSVIVMLDSNSGELLNMRVCYEPLEISPTPSLTKEEIAQIVASYLYGLGAQVVYIRDIGGPRGWYVAREEPYGQQRLYTYAIVRIEGLQSFPDSNYYGFVDGHTGEFFDARAADIAAIPLQFYSSTKAAETPPVPGLLFNGMRVNKPKRQPILENGKVYISFDDMKNWGFKLRPSGKKYVIYYKENRKNRAFLDEDDIKEAKEGIRYLKGEALNKLKGVFTRYIKDKNYFHIVVLDEKAFMKGQADRTRLIKKSKR